MNVARQLVISRSVQFGISLVMSTTPIPRRDDVDKIYPDFVWKRTKVNGIFMNILHEYEFCAGNILASSGVSCIWAGPGGGI